MALLSKFFGRTASEGAAFALGLATGPVLAPEVEELKNATWRLNPTRTVDPAAAAQIVAEDVEQRDWGANEASAHGINGDRFDAIVGEVLNAPGMGELLQARRRGLISDSQFHHGLRKAKLETLWDNALVGLLDVLLTPAELANARQQGYIDQARQHAEALLWGIDAERAEIQFESVGLPPGPATMQTAFNRGFIDRATFDQAIREGHTKTKYTDLLFALRQPLLAASVGVRLFLKGWWTQAQRDALGEEWGYTPQQMNDWYLSMGRPAAPGQMWTAAARGVDGPDGQPMNEAQFLKGIKESDIRPEWGPMLWGIRYLYPPLFQLSRLVTAGIITPAVGAEWATKARYAPEVVDALMKSWATTAPAAAKHPYVTKADNQLWTATHKGFIGGELDEPRATVALHMIGIPAGDQTEIFRLWTEEKSLTVKPLTPSQIKKAYKDNLLTLDEATQRLEERGYTPADANLLLTE